MDEIVKNKYAIDNLIYKVRNKQVMLDSDLAFLYECANGTKTINQAVKRNQERFPKDFYFQLTEQEFLDLKSQFGTSSGGADGHGGVRKLPYAFTEQGVAMLAAVIRTPVAVKMSVSIMRAFVAMRKYMSKGLVEQKYINNLVLEDHDKIRLLEESFKKFEKVEKNHEIYFDGQVYDAYSKIREICNDARNKIVIIDSYADGVLLDIIKRLKVKVVIVTKPRNLLTTQDVAKYNEQYNNLVVKYSDAFHDRYLILDDKKVYHCGASINRIGYKVFSITRVGDDEICKMLVRKVEKLDLPMDIEG